MATNNIVAFSSPDGIQIFPTGTRLGFNQTAAPVGWTKDTTTALNDSIMRIVTGTATSGGTGAISSGCTTVAAHTHAWSGTSSGRSAAHSHGTAAATTAGGTTSTESAYHSHTYYAASQPGNSLGGQPMSTNYSYNGNIGGFTSSVQSALHVHAMPGLTMAASTSGTESADHSHTVSGTTADSLISGTWIPKYNDFIIASKN